MRFFSIFVLLADLTQRLLPIMKYTILILLFFVSIIGFTQQKSEYQPISEMNNEEKEMYELLQQSVTALRKDQPFVKLFPLFKTRQVENGFVFTSLIYDETYYNHWDDIAHSATYNVELHFTKQFRKEDNPNVKYYTDNPDYAKNIKERTEFYLSVEYPKPGYNSANKTLLTLKKNKPFFDDKYSKVTLVKSMRTNYVNPEVYTIDASSTVHFINADYAIFEKNDLYGIANNKNKTIVPFQYNSLRKYPMGLLAKENDSYFFIDVKGDKISKVYDKIDVTFGKIFPKLKNYFKAKLGDKYTLVSPSFEEKFPLIYDEILPFYDTKNSPTKLLLTKDKKQIVFDIEKWQETDLIFDTIVVISSKSMIVEKDKKFGILETNGTPILNIEYDSITYLSGYFEAVLFEIKKDNKAALYVENKFLTNFEYDSIVSLVSYLKAEKKGKFGLINQKGEVVLPVEYDSIELNKKTKKIEAVKDSKISYFGLDELHKK